MKNYMEEAKAMLENITLDGLAECYMDDEIREDLHIKMAPCTDEEFLAAYLEKHEEKFGEPLHYC